VDSLSLNPPYRYPETKEQFLRWFQIRVYHRKSTGRKSPRYLLKCGCCNEKIEIHYDVNGPEIGGVNGAVEDWREIFLPLLQANRKLKQKKYRIGKCEKTLP